MVRLETPLYEFDAALWANAAAAAPNHGPENLDFVHKKDPWIGNHR